MPFESFRDSLNSLDPDGDDGFEGLMAVVLGHVTGVRFTLASSGTQQGRDGQSIFNRDSVAFEAKRYDKPVPKDKILTKFMELGATGTSPPEMYIVAATCEISSQLSNVMENGANNIGMHLLVLAWPKNQLSELACIICMAADKAADFISQKTGISKALLLEQMQEIKSHIDYSSRCKEITEKLEAPYIAPALAIEKNRTWLRAALSDKSKARQCFGQSLCPLDTVATKVLVREKLQKDLENSVYEQSGQNVVVLLGADGNGKSWIFGQMWASRREPALTIILTPSDFENVSREACQDLLIKKIIFQTDDLDTAHVKDRWVKHFDRWRKRRGTPQPSLVVFIDGINQRINMDWAQVIDIVQGLVEGLGGRLVVSCREIFYKEKLRNVTSSVVKLSVPHWSKAELDILLKDFDISAESLSPEVRRSLLNPRIFGVAAQLYRTREVLNFSELSVGRLMFEHIRLGGEIAGLDYTSTDFKQLICDHASSIVARMRNGDTESYDEFEVGQLGAGRERFQAELLITSSGRFFEALPGEPGKYLIREEGLQIALGLMLVSTACSLNRKKKNIEEGLAQILEPISAMDITANVLLNAINSAVLDELGPDVVSALIESLVGLQNLNSDRYQEFKAMFRRTPDAYFKALESSFLTSRTVPSIFWLTDLVLEHKAAKDFEGCYQVWVNRWFRFYSLSPERKVGQVRMHNTPEDHRKRLIERGVEIEDLVSSLTPLENELLEQMCREDRGDYSKLNRFAVNVVAGHEIDTYSTSLALSFFSDALNGGFGSASSELYELISLNVIDWVEFRNSLRLKLDEWAADRLSAIGKRAIINGLRSTGDSQDASRAKLLAREMDGEAREGQHWRLIEKYCSVDPCDPTSQEPENIVGTLQQFKGLDLSDLWAKRYCSEQDHFFLMSLTGLARFRTSETIEVMRSLAGNIASRDVDALLYAAYELALHSSAISSNEVKSLVNKAKEIAGLASGPQIDEMNSLWSRAQFLLFTALPHMSGVEQFETLLAHPEDVTTLWDLKYTFKPIPPLVAEEALHRSIVDCNVSMQFRIIFFVEYSGSPASDKFNKLLETLVASPNDLVRLSALSYIDSVKEYGLLASVANTWSSSVASGKGESIERDYGSQALIGAAVLGLISLEDCFDKISPSAWSAFARELGEQALQLICPRLEFLVRRALQFSVPEGLPYIQKQIAGSFHPVSVSVHTWPSVEQADSGLANKGGDNFESFVQRSKDNQQAYDSLVESVASSEAALIIEFLDGDLIRALLGYDKKLVSGLVGLVLAADTASLRNIKPFALALAESISFENEDLASSVIKKVAVVTGHVDVVLGHARVSLESVVFWRCFASEARRKIVYSRLDSAHNDYVTSMEVLAAYNAGRADIIKSYVIDRRGRPETLFRARAASVGAFCFNESWACEAVDGLADEVGFLSHVYKAAKYVQERHVWTMHWLGELASAKTNEDVWRSSILIAKIADARFYMWYENYFFKGDELCLNFMGMILRQVGSRVKKWKSEREKKLFGLAAPDPVLLPPILL